MTLLDTTNPDVAAGEAIGQWIGAGMVLVVCLVGIIKLVQKSSQPDTNPKAAIGLAFALFGWVIASLFRPAKLEQGPVLWACLGGAVLASFVSVLLGLIALVEISRSERPVKKTQAVAAILVGGVMGALLCGGFTVGYLKQRAKAKELVADDGAAEGKTLKFEHENFSFEMPGKPWVQLNAKKLSPLASVAVSRSNPEMMMMIISEHTDAAPTTELLSEVMKSNLAKNTAESEEKWEKPRTTHGLHGIATRVDAKVKTQRFVYVLFALAYRHQLYQITVWGPPSEADTVEREAEMLVKHFDVLERDDEKGPD